MSPAAGGERLRSEGARKYSPLASTNTHRHLFRKNGRMVSENYLASLPDRGGRIVMESVVGYSWTGWPDDRGIRNHLFVSPDSRSDCLVNQLDMPPPPYCFNAEHLS